MIKKITTSALMLVFTFGMLLPTSQVLADDAATSATVTNAPPVSSAVLIIGDTLTLTEATTTNVVVTATVTDNNGFADITSVQAKLFRTDVTSSASGDPLNHYTSACTVVETGSGLSQNYTCTFAVQYYADATDAGAYSEDTWSAEVTPSDADGAGTAGTNDTAEMATTVALDVTIAIAYGEMALAATTPDTTAFDTIVTNTGNQASIGAQVNSGADTAMACAIGSIPVGNEKYHAVSTTAFASKTALTDTAATVSDVAATKGASGNTDTIGWGLQMPADGVSGACSGSVVFTAV